MLEAGRVRSKNSINVAQKNLSDLIISWSGFFLLGYWLMFGQTVTGLQPVSSDQILMFFYHLAFCATAASIVSGGVAERMSYVGYLILTGTTAVLIYPLVGRWIWGELGGGWHGSWLAELGFVDFAGSTVVHGVGAWVALAGIVVVGPRAGRFDKSGRVQPMHGHSAVFSLLGALILLVGWFGFNGGTVSPADERFASIMLATSAAGCFGAATGLIIGVWLDNGVFNPSRMCSGLLGGLVAITAGVHLAQAFEAAIVGVLGGAVATAGSHWLLHQRKLDDPVDVVATHGFAGVLGTLAVAFLASPEQLPTGSRLIQLATQMAGVAVVLVVAFLLAMITLKLVSRICVIRISDAQQKLGLNCTEHGEALGAERLQHALDDDLASGNTSSKNFIVDGDEDTQALAAAVNSLLDRNERARAQIEISHKRFEQFALTASDWLWETDVKLNLLHLSAHNQQIDPRLRQALSKRHWAKLLRYHPKDRASVLSALRERAEFRVSEAHLRMPDKSERLVEVRAIPYHDENGHFAGYRGTFHDVTERRLAERRAIFLSRHDSLTGLPNRRALSEDTHRMLNRYTSQGQISIIAIDLDGFKAVNDGYGHSAGDQLLQLVASRLQKSMGEGDVIYRTGGDEFVVLTNNNYNFPYELQTFCNKLIERISKPYRVDQHSFELGASIGMAQYPRHTTDTDRLLDLADLALYAAKDNGKGCALEFEPWMDDDARKHAFLEEALRDALRCDQFTLQYQPQYDRPGTTLMGFEALLRWNHPELGNVSPAIFIPVAERLNLMDEIGKYVLKTACEFASNWPVQTNIPAPTIAVNVSPSQLIKKDFIALLNTVLDETGLKPARLELEITEEMLISDFEYLRNTLLSIRNIGVKIAIDDFGSGQTSLRYLNNLPVDKLKIDRAFIQGIETDERAQEIAQSIVMLGHKLGCQVTAEGVELPAQAVILQRWRCDQMQGFMYAKPLSSTDAMNLLQTLSANPHTDDGEDTFDTRNAA